MKLQVVRSDKSVEIITLTEPVEIQRGDILNRLVTSTGMEHWFRTNDGTYDGWGMACNIPIPDGGPLAPGSEALDLIERTEAGREFPSPEQGK